MNSLVPSSGRGRGFRVAIVGASTLKGKEVAEVLSARNFPNRDIKLLDDDETMGKLTAVGDEVTFVQSIRPEQFEGVDFAFFASSAEFTRSHWKLAQQAGSVVVDLSFALEQEPGAVLRAPWLEREPGRAQPPESSPVVIAHPAATVLALLLSRAQKAGPVRSAVATVFEPVSERGQPGVDELHEQTIGLFSFHDLPKNIFDAQVAFNLVSRYGEKSEPPLEAVERRLLDHLRRIAGEPLVPSLMLVQAPVFHGYVFSIYLEMEPMVSDGDMAQALAGEHVTIARLPETSPSNVQAAGQDDILVALRRDATREHGLWIWAAVDNLRVIADSAVACAESMGAVRGPVQ
jgi:aspartate-semialdehyde dehydrogenase